MISATHLRTAIAIAAFSMMAASPALAQGNGKAKGKQRKAAESAQVERAQRERPILQRRAEGSATPRPRADDRYEDERYEDARRTDRRSSSTWEDILWGTDDRRRRDVPPGWCRGRGNPHNTPENCGYSSDRRYDWDYDDRYGGYGSYADAHTAFHRALDREYSARAAQRRTDPVYQIRLRAEKAADHQRWHERTGTRH